MDIVRAWKDATYRQSLSAEQQANLPVNPAGEVELSDAELEIVNGAHGCHDRDKVTQGQSESFLCVYSVLIADCSNSTSEDNQ